MKCGKDHNLECGFFESRTFPWSPSKVEVRTFYSFKLKVGSKYTPTFYMKLQCEANNYSAESSG